MSEGDSHTQYPNMENNQYGAYFRTRNQIKYRDCSTLDACFIEAATCEPSNEEEYMLCATYGSGRSGPFWIRGTEVQTSA